MGEIGKIREVDRRFRRLDRLPDTLDMGGHIAPSGSGLPVDESLLMQPLQVAKNVIPTLPAEEVLPAQLVRRSCAGDRRSILVVLLVVQELTEKQRSG